MSYERRRRGMDLTANALLTHGVPHYQGGVAGVPIKQDNPKTLDSLASRTQIASGVKYFLRTKGECDVDATSLAGATVGQAVYIVKTTDALTLAAGSTGLNLPFGRVTHIGGTAGSPDASAYGTAAGRIRIDMDLKDTITVP